MSDSAALTALLRTGDTHKFYASPEWRRLRKEILTRDRHTCVRCKRKGKYTRANTVHHRKEIKDFPSMALTPDNLESVCHSCHDAIHGRDSSKLKSKERKLFLPERW